MAGMSITGDALLGAGSSLVGNVASLIAGRSNADRAFKQQKELMALQNQYSVENWNRENAYNTPKAQMERLKSAGLNPNLVYNGGAGALQSGAISAPSAPGSQMAPTPDFSSSVGDAVQAAVGVSQAKKAGSETIKQDIENKYLSDRILADIAQTKAYTDLSKEQKAKVNMECQNLSAQWNKMQQEINLLEKENKLKQKDVDTYDRRLKAEIDYMAANTSYTKEQRDFLRDNKENLVALTKAQADLQTTIATLTAQYGDAQMIIGMITQVIGAGADLLNAIPGIGNLLRGTKVLTGKTTTNFAGGKHETYHYGQ